MAIAARRLGLDPAELARRNLVAADDDAVPHAVRSAVRLGRLRRLPRPRARARGLRRPACPRGERESRGAARGDRAGLRRRAVDLEHGLHHAGADGRGARRHAAEVGERRGRLGRDRPARRDHRPAGDDAAGPGAPHGVRPGRRRRARLRPRGRHRPVRDGHRDVPWTVASGNYSSRFSGVAVGAVQAAALKLRAKIDAIRAHVGDGRCRSAASRGRRTGTPRAFPTARSPVSRGRVLGAAEPRPARRRGPRGVVRGPRPHRRRLRRRGRPRDRGRDGARLRDGPRRGSPPQPAARRRSGARRLRARRRRRALRAPRLRRRRAT